MGDIFVKIKIMPTSPEADLAAIEAAAGGEIEGFGAKVAKAEQEPIAFGLKAVIVTFVAPETDGGLDPLEEKIAGLDNVESAQIISVDRALG